MPRSLCLTRSPSLPRIPQNGEVYARILHAHDQADRSPPRPWQTGDRRSPPSETFDSRRRTRARHSSFRGAPGSTSAYHARPASYAGNSAATSQQSPGRERVSVFPYYFPYSGVGSLADSSRHGIQQFQGNFHRSYNHYMSSRHMNPSIPIPGAIETDLLYGRAQSVTIAPPAPHYQSRGQQTHTAVFTPAVAGLAGPASAEEQRAPGTAPPAPPSGPAAGYNPAPPLPSIDTFPSQPGDWSPMQQ
jgi:hypothetical protein